MNKAETAQRVEAPVVESRPYTRTKARLRSLAESRASTMVAGLLVALMTWPVMSSEVAIADGHPIRPRGGQMTYEFLGIPVGATPNP